MTAILSLAAVLSCGSPLDFCKATADTACKKVFECGTEAEKAELGTSVADCRTKLEGRFECSKYKSTEDYCVGKKFDSGKADACLTKVGALSCATAANSAYPYGITECTEICK